MTMKRQTKRPAKRQTAKQTKTKATRRAAAETLPQAAVPEPLPALPMSEDEWAMLGKEMLEGIGPTARFVADWLTRCCFLYEGLLDGKLSPQSREAVEKALDEKDSAIASVFRAFDLIFWHRVQRTKNNDLLFEGLGMWNSVSRFLPDLLQKGADQTTDNPDDPENVMTNFAETMCDLTKALEGFSETHAAWLRHAAGDVPYWPMLRFHHEEANNHFDRLAQAIGLGKTCAIRVDGAKYSLEVPINAYLFRVLRCFQYMDWLMRESKAAQHLGDDYIHRANWFGRKLTDAEMTLFKHVATLPPLVATPESVRQWVDEAIMPFIFTEECEGKQDLAKLLAVPAFAAYLKNRRNINKYSDGRRAIRNTILQQLRGLAHLPKPVLSEAPAVVGQASPKTPPA